MRLHEAAAGIGDRGNEMRRRFASGTIARLLMQPFPHGCLMETEFPRERGLAADDLYGAFKSIHNANDNAPGK